ncbi:MAG: TonB-dependent receptor, partial [Bacteroidota bacterium]
SISLFSQQKKIELPPHPTPLKSVFEYLEKEHGFHFSYKEKDNAGISVTPPRGKKNINDFLKNILTTKGLQFEIVDRNYIVISKTQLSEKLKIPDKTSKLCGRVIDKFTNEPLSFANVYIQKTQEGVSTDEAGFFDFKIKIRPTDTVVISYVGYQEQKIAAQKIADRPCLDVALDYFEFAAGLIVVKDYLTDGIDLSENGIATTLQPNRIGSLPGQVEPDILKTIQFLPGITSTDGSASNISIRGGTSDQNLILWENIPIYHSAHYFGMISAFNPYIINEAKVYRGGFDANYGGRISGVIDLKSDGANLSKNKLNAGVNFINAFANGSFLLPNKKASVVFSVRRSYADLWKSPTFTNISRRIHQGVLFESTNINRLPRGVTIEDNFIFQDANLKTTFRPSDKAEISVAGFYMNNNFDAQIRNNELMQRQRDSLYLQNTGLNFTWKHQWSNQFSTEWIGVFTDYNYDYDYSLVTMSQNGLNREGIKESRIQEGQLQFINQYRFSNQNTLDVGYQHSDYDVSYQITRLIQGNANADRAQDNSSKVHNFFTKWNYAIHDKFGFNAGLRYSYFQEANQSVWEPRFRLWYRPDKHWNFYFNTGIYHQFISELIEIQGDQSFIETPVWVLAGNLEMEANIPVLRSIQHQVGAVFEKNNWLLDVQFYLKNIDGLTSLASGFDDELTNRFHTGEARIFGFDFLLKKRIRNYRTWLSYSYTDALYRFDTFFDTEFTPANNLPHVFHWVHLIEVKPFEFSVGWKYASSTPYSDRAFFNVRVNPPSPDVPPGHVVEPLEQSINSRRLPYVHQLDVSVMYQFKPKRSDQWKGTIGLSVFNVYNQENLYQRGFLVDIDPMEPPRLRYFNKSDLRFTPNL